MSLRRRFVLVFVGFTVLLAAAGGWASWRLAAGALERELDDKLLSVAGAAVATGGIPAGIVPAFRPGDEDLGSWQALHARLQGLQEEVAEAYVVDRQGRALVTTEAPDRLPIGAPVTLLEPYSAELERAWGGEEVTTPLFEGEDGGRYKYGFVPLRGPDPEAGPEAILAVSMAAEYLAPLASLRRTVLWGGVLAAMLGGLLAAVLAATVIRPVERLSRAAGRIERGRWEDPVEVAGTDELGRLSRAMERMRQGILQRDEQLRLMLSQVAHEIRNPLGGLELFASAARDTDDPEERDRLLERVRREVVALNRIIGDFLTFSRPPLPQPSDHDIRQPLGEAVELVRGDARARGREVEVGFPEGPLTARADPDHVKRVALNLLRNGLEAGRRVRLAAAPDGGEVVVSVRDDGPGVPEGLRERIFDPFVTDREQGAGLGLAIVRKVAEANGGRVELMPGSPEGFGNGAEFRVYFPLVETVPAAESPEEAAVGPVRR